MCIYVVATTAEYVIKFWDITSDMVIYSSYINILSLLLTNTFC